MNNKSALSREILEAARRALSLDRTEIDAKIAEIDMLLNGGKQRQEAPAASSEKASASAITKRTLSPQARKRMAVAQKKRWASKGEAEVTAEKVILVSAGKAKKVPKPKRVMSPETRARMAEGQRKRWANKEK